METLKEGHLYGLEFFEEKDADMQTIRFIEKEPDEDDPTKLVTVQDGTTNEEVLKMLINRFEYLYNKMPSKETADGIEHLKIALNLQEQRTADRKKRKVEGTHKA